MWLWDWDGVVLKAGQFEDETQIAHWRYKSRERDSLPIVPVCGQKTMIMVRHNHMLLMCVCTHVYNCAQTYKDGAGLVWLFNWFLFQIRPSPPPADYHQHTGTGRGVNLTATLVNQSCAHHHHHHLRLILTIDHHHHHNMTSSTHFRLELIITLSGTRLSCQVVWWWWWWFVEPVAIVGSRTKPALCIDLINSCNLMPSSNQGDKRWH